MKKRLYNVIHLETKMSQMESPFFVLQTASYNRMLKKFKKGSKSEWSYIGKCLHPGNCTCQKKLNVYRDGKIWRLKSGVWKEVIKCEDIPKKLTEYGLCGIGICVHV